MSNWKKILPNRVPSYLRREDTPLHSYLEFVGEIFDEISDEIKGFDNYKDYRNSPESRLSIIASRFGFNIPATIPAEMMREVIQDLGYLNRTRGTTDSIRFAFRLLGWEVNLRQAWLPEPERFDSRIKTSFSELYLGDDVDANEVSDANLAFVPTFGDGYLLASPNQTYKKDPLYVIDGHWHIGVSQLRFSDSVTQDFTPQIEDRYYLKTSDISKVDYRSFVYGEAKATESGTYFVGGSWFTSIENMPPLRILGENYDSPDALKYGIKVMSTPYLVVEVSTTEFDRFTIGDNQTRQEQYQTAEVLFNYILDEFVRPANVKVLVIFGSSALENKITISEQFSQTATHEPDTNVTNVGISVDNTDYEHGTWHTIGGDANYVIGAPTYHSTNSFSGVNAVTDYTSGDFVDGIVMDGTSSVGVGADDFYRQKYVVGNTEFSYSYTHDLREHEQVIVKDSQAPLVEDVVLDGIYQTVGGLYNIEERYTEILPLRTPSTVEIIYPTHLVGTNVRVLGVPSGDVHQSEMTTLSNINGSLTYRTYDIQYLALEADVDITGIQINVTWLDQTTLTPSQTTQTLTVI